MVWAFTRYSPQHTHTIAIRLTHKSPGGDRGRMVGLTETHWRARKTGTHSRSTALARRSTQDPIARFPSHYPLPYQACVLRSAVRPSPAWISNPSLASTHPRGPDLSPSRGLGHSRMLLHIANARVTCSLVALRAVSRQTQQHKHSS